jgi:undecaprenyl-diphosphatase
LSVSAEPVLWGALTLAAALSAATAFAAIAAFLRLVERIGLWAFAVYRLLLAGLILIVLY